MSPELLLQEYQRLHGEVEQRDETIRRLHDENQFLKNRIDWFERQIFGQKRERFIPTDQNQVTLDLGIASTVEEPVTEHVEFDRKKKKKATPHGREEIPAHLPRVKEYIDPDFDTTGMEKFADKITEELHYKPAVFFVKQIIRPVMRAVIDGLPTVQCPELPPRCIDKGKAGASLVAQTIVGKCVDHTPLYRFGQQIKRNCDMNIPLTTIEGWYAKGIFWLEPIAQRLHEIILQHDYMQLDESTLKVMVKPTRGKSHKGYMILCNSPELNIVTFHYRRTRNEKLIAELVGPDYQGILQSDGLKLYLQFDTWDGIIHAGCGAHARRYFKEALKTDRNRAEVVLDMWQSLFKIEATARENNLDPEERLQLRQDLSLPIMNNLKEWLEDNKAAATPKNPIRKAIAYSLNRWEALTRFLHDGRIEISNNLIENRVRPLALGRKNWMFAGSAEGARRLATGYTVMGTCILNGLNPFDYTTSVLEQLPARKAGDIDDLLPINWSPTSKKQI